MDFHDKSDSVFPTENTIIYFTHKIQMFSCSILYDVALYLCCVYVWGCVWDCVRYVRFQCFYILCVFVIFRVISNPNDMNTTIYGSVWLYGIMVYALEKCAYDLRRLHFIEFHFWRIFNSIGSNRNCVLFSVIPTNTNRIYVYT